MSHKVKGILFLVAYLLVAFVVSAAVDVYTGYEAMGGTTAARAHDFVQRFIGMLMVATFFSFFKSLMNNK